MQKLAGWISIEYSIDAKTGAPGSAIGSRLIATSGHASCDNEVDLSLIYFVIHLLQRLGYLR